MARVALLLMVLLATPWLVEGGSATVQVGAVSATSVREWSSRVDGLVLAGGLAIRLARTDTMISGRRHERLAQFHEGVRVFGGELIRQSDPSGPLTVFGTYYDDIDVDVAPTLGPRDIESRLAGRGGRPFGARGGPELLVLPLETAGYRLAWRVRAFFDKPFDVRQVLFDAHSGATLLEYRDIHSQAAGNATGVLGDRKKISVTPSEDGWLADDQLRPPSISTYDFRFDPNRLILFLNAGGRPSDLSTADLGSDSDNEWTDGALVDAHVHAGYVYDFLYERFGRRGLDDANIPIHSITHALHRDDWRLFTPETVGLFFANAFYLGEGVMYYGDGLPPDVTLGGKQWNYLAGGLDVVAHELMHGVIDYSSQLVYDGNAGALAEAFCDFMGHAVEFFAQPERGDYLAGEDVVTPGGIRSAQNPFAYGHPDHVVDWISPGYQGIDRVHFNSNVYAHAFYLAIEGGTHRMGATVHGVGSVNREQIEKVIYRAFTTLMPPRANSCQAHNATIQAARELYGEQSLAEQALRQAFSAVGLVNCDRWFARGSSHE